MKKSLFAGSMAGLGIGALIALLGTANQGANEFLQWAVNFFGSVPAYFIMTYNLPAPAGIAVFFTYWALVGSVFGALACLPPKTRPVLMILFLISLATAHALIQTAMEHEIQAIVNSLGQILKELFGAPSH